MLLCVMSIGKMADDSQKLMMATQLTRLVLSQVRLDIGTKVDVYYLYATFMIRTGFSFPSEVLTYPSFVKVWRDEFPQLKLRKKRTVSSKCLVCDDLEVGVRSSRHYHRPSGTEYDFHLSQLCALFHFPASCEDREGPQETGSAPFATVRSPALPAGRKAILLQ